MRTRIAMSFTLAALVVASVFSLIQFSSTPSVGADSTNVNLTSASNSVAVTSLQQSGAINNTNSFDQENVTQQELDPALIYVYPDGSIAPPPGSYSTESSSYYEDDDHDEYEDHDDYEDHERYESDHDDDDGLWNRLTSLRFGDDDDHDDYDDDDHHDAHDDDRDHDEAEDKHITEHRDDD